VQRGEWKTAEHRRIPRRDPSICSQRIVFEEPRIQISVQPIGLADKYSRTDKLLPEYDRNAARQQGKDNGLVGMYAFFDFHTQRQDDFCWKVKGWKPNRVRTATRRQLEAHRPRGRVASVSIRNSFN
jgi:hypothetical protein